MYVSQIVWHNLINHEGINKNFWDPAKFGVNYSFMTLQKLINLEGKLEFHSIIKEHLIIKSHVLLNL